MYTTTAPYHEKQYLSCKNVMMAFAAILFLLSAASFGIIAYAIHYLSESYGGTSSTDTLLISLATSAAMCLFLGIASFAFMPRGKTKIPFLLFAIVELLAFAVLLYTVKDGLKEIESEFGSTITFSLFILPVIVAVLLVIGSLSAVKKTAALAVLGAIAVVLGFYAFKDISFYVDMFSIMYRQSMDRAMSYGLSIPEIPSHYMFLTKFALAYTFMMPTAITLALIGMHEVKPAITTTPYVGYPYVGGSHASPTPGAMPHTPPDYPTHIGEDEPTVKMGAHAFPPESASFEPPVTPVIPETPRERAEAAPFETPASPTPPPSPGSLKMPTPSDSFASAPKPKAPSRHVDGAFKKADDDPFK